MILYQAFHWAFDDFQIHIHTFYISFQQFFIMKCQDNEMNGNLS